MIASTLRGALLAVAALAVLVSPIACGLAFLVLWSAPFFWGLFALVVLAPAMLLLVASVWLLGRRPLSGAR